MRVITVGLTVFLCLARAVLAEDAAGAAQRVIDAQIKAFLQDDAERAYSFASPAIRALFPDRLRFFDMVKRSYAPVYRPGNYAFGRARAMDGDGLLYQEVVITGRDGKDWTAIYQMQRQADGEFRINGVQILPQAESKGI